MRFGASPTWAPKLKIFEAVKIRQTGELAARDLRLSANSLAQWVSSLSESPITDSLLRGEEQLKFAERIFSTLVV